MNKYPLPQGVVGYRKKIQIDILLFCFFIFLSLLKKVKIDTEKSENGIKTENLLTFISAMRRINAICQIAITSVKNM